MVNKFIMTVVTIALSSGVAMAQMTGDVDVNAPSGMASTDGANVNGSEGTASTGGTDANLAEGTLHLDSMDTEEPGLPDLLGPVTNYVGDTVENAQSQVTDTVDLVGDLTGSLGGVTSLLGGILP